MIIIEFIWISVKLFCSFRAVKRKGFGRHSDASAKSSENHDGSSNRHPSAKLSTSSATGAASTSRNNSGSHSGGGNGSHGNAPSTSGNQNEGETNKDSPNGKQDTSETAPPASSLSRASNASGHSATIPQSASSISSGSKDVLHPQVNSTLKIYIYHRCYTSLDVFYSIYIMIFFIKHLFFLFLAKIWQERHYIILCRIEDCLV